MGTHIWEGNRVLEFNDGLERSDALWERTEHDSGVKVFEYLKLKFSKFDIYVRVWKSNYG